MRRLPLLLALTALAAVAAAATEPGYVTVAHSAQVVLEAARTPAGISLRAHRAGSTAALAGSALTAAIDGRSATVTANADGSWNAAWPRGAAGGANQLEVVLTHDGIRELLSGTLPAAAGAATPGTGVLGDHKQMAWWILNIVIVTIAVLAISRRMS